VAVRTPPFKNFPEWTTSKFFSFIRSGLREKFNRYPVKYKVLQDSSRTVRVSDAEGNPVSYKTGKNAGMPKYTKEYKCKKCGEWFKQKNVQVDHIIPAGSLKSFEDLGGFVERLFTNADGLQVLCTECHDIKTKKEKLK